MPEICSTQRTDEWHKARAGRITGSTAAACLGLNEHVGHLAAWRRIMGITVDQDNWHMKRGRDNEGDIVSDYEVATGNLVRSTGFWRHPEFEWLGSSPDGTIFDGSGSDGILEVKAPMVVPATICPAHHIQIQVGMACLGLSWGHYFCRDVTGKTFLQRIDRNPLHEYGILSMLEQFYLKFIKTPTEPPRTKVVLWRILPKQEWLEQVA
jgi:predicted phage-related endonuclease